MQNTAETAAVDYCQPMTFNEGNKTINPVLINGEPHFIAIEVCEILDLDNVTRALDGLDDDEYLPLQLVRAGQRRDVNLVTESGLYHLIIKSRKPEARAFRKWVTSEVLPALRRTGGYSVPGGAAVGRPRLSADEANDFAVRVYRELLKVDNARVRNTLASMVEGHILKLMS